MTTREPTPDEGPELLPPVELLRLRAELARPPAPEVRAGHLAAAVHAARHRRPGSMGRFASRGARAAVAIVASLAITSGLASAQLLPDQAQRILSNVSERFAPTDEHPPADPARPGDATTTVRSEPEDDGREDDTPAPDVVVTTEPVADVLTVPETSTTRPSTGTTIPGPGGPGSPDDPNDPAATTTTTGPSTTTTTTGPPTTTTTVPPTTTTTTTVVGGEKR